MTTKVDRSSVGSEYERGFQNACLVLAHLVVLVASVWIDPGYSVVWWKRSVTALWIDFGHFQGVTTLVSLVALALLGSVVWAELSAQRREDHARISTPRSSSVVDILRSRDGTKSVVIARRGVADHQRVPHRRAS